MNKKKIAIYLVILATLIVFVVLSFFLDGESELKILWKTLTFTGTAISFVLFMYDLFIWKLVYTKLPVKIKTTFKIPPVISGKWSGTLSWTYLCFNKNNCSGEDCLCKKTENKSFSIEFKQHKREIVVYYSSKSAESHSTKCSFVFLNNKWQIFYEYFMEPTKSYENNLPHLGFCKMFVIDNKTISGRYITERNTRGDIELKKN